MRRSAGAQLSALTVTLDIEAPECAPGALPAGDPPPALPAPAIVNVAATSVAAVMLVVAGAAILVAGAAILVAGRGGALAASLTLAGRRSLPSPWWRTVLS